MSERVHQHTIPWRRVAAIVLVMTFGFSLLWMVIRAFGETEYDPAPTPVPSSPGLATETPAATPTVTSEVEATPDVPEWRAGSLPDLLTLAPDRLSNNSLPLNDVAQYSDLSAWIAANGTNGGLSDAEWQAAIEAMAIPASLSEFGLTPVWSQTYGFDLRQVHQVLVLGQAPDYVMIITGEFDAAALQSAWVSSGYQAVEARGTTVWSLYPGDQIDLSAPESRPAMGTMNNVVLLEDGTLVAAARLSRLESVLDVVNGNASSLAEQKDVAAMLATAGPDTEALTSAVLARGTALQGSDATMPRIATPTSATPGAALSSEGIPTVSLVLSGIAAPQGETARMAMWLVFDGQPSAASAVPVIRTRLVEGVSPVTDAPYRERLAEPVVRRIGEVVMIEATLTHGVVDWRSMLQARDLGFAFWLPDEN